MQALLHILIVDDDPDILELLTDTFSFSGHTAEVASSGELAIHLLKSQTFDVVVSDYHMPNGNGLAVLDYVKSMKNKPIVYILSAQKELGPEVFTEAGARKIFLKPFQLLMLIDEIEDLSYSSRP